MKIGLREVNPTQLEALCQAAKITLQKLDFSNKRAIIRDLVDKVIVYGQKQVEICGHIPLTTQKLGSYDENRHPENVIYTFEAKLVLPFPKPRKERIIVERDNLGRIVHSKPPALPKT